MRPPSRSTGPWFAWLVAGTIVALVATGCVAGATASAAAPSPTAPLSIASAAATESPAPVATASQAASTDRPTASVIPSTRTDWGVILDAVPDTFPRYPDATDSQPPSEPVSGALETTASVDDVADWYRDALGSAGFAAIDLSSQLEDGSRVLDAATSAADCRAQLTFRPLGGVTMIIVLYGAGCAGTSS